jgi:hypothetical protein
MAEEHAKYMMRLSDRKVFPWSEALSKREGFVPFDPDKAEGRKKEVEKRLKALKVLTKDGIEWEKVDECIETINLINELQSTEFDIKWLKDETERRKLAAESEG